MSGFTGDVTVTGFTIVTGPASTVGSNAIYISGIGAGSTITINNNELRCVQSVLGTAEDNYGLIAGYGSAGHLVFDRNTVYGGASNAVLLERWTGPVDFTSNLIYRGPDDTITGKDAIFVMNYGASDITAKQRFDGNTVDLGGGVTFDTDHRGTGISVVAQYVGGAGPGGYTDVEITHNNFINLKPFRRGIGLWDNSSGPGNVVAVISCNSVSPAPGYTGDHGIRLLGGITGGTITGNNLSGLGTGFKAQPWNGFDPTGFTLSSNNITGNGIGVENAGATGFVADNNWWGSPAGPPGTEHDRDQRSGDGCHLAHGGAAELQRRPRLRHAGGAGDLHHADVCLRAGAGELQPHRHHSGARLQRDADAVLEPGAVRRGHRRGHLPEQRRRDQLPGAVNLERRGLHGGLRHPGRDRRGRPVRGRCSRSTWLAR